MNPKIKLNVWMGGGVPAEPAPPPTAVEVLYSGPNADGTRKACQNCMLWMGSEQQCTIHKPDVVVTPESICGYHVNGMPAYLTARHSGGGIEPFESGLIEFPGGTACDNCRNYLPDPSLSSGVCHAVRDPDSGASAMVNALGCCTRWDGQDGT